MLSDVEQDDILCPSKGLAWRRRNMWIISFKNTELLTVRVGHEGSVYVRQFLTQPGLSVENSLFRLKPKSNFLTQSKKRLFRLNIFRLSFRHNLTFSTWYASQKKQSKTFIPIYNSSYRSSNSKTYTHIPGITQQHHTTAPTLASLLLMLLLATSQHGALQPPLTSGVYNTTPVALVIDAISPTTATPAVTAAALIGVQRDERRFDGFWLSPMPPTRFEEGSSQAKHALLVKNARSTELPTDFALLYSTTPSHQSPIGRAQQL